MPLSTPTTEEVLKELEQQTLAAKHLSWWRDYIRRAVHDDDSLEDLALALWHKYHHHERLALDSLKDCVDEAMTETTFAAFEE